MKKKYSALWDKLVGPLMLAVIIGVIALAVAALDWLPRQEFYPYVEKGLEGVERAYWGFALIMFSYWIGRFIMSYNMDKGASRGLAIAVTVVCTPFVVWLIASWPRNDSWGERETWNEFVRLCLIALPAVFVGTMGKPVDMPHEDKHY